MAKGTYDVCENTPPPKDGSFRSCLCAMLVFVAICIILLLAAWPWRSTTKTPETKEKINEQKKFEKITGVLGKTAESEVNQTMEITSTTTRPYIEKLPIMNDTSFNTETTTNNIDENITVVNDSKTEIKSLQTTTIPYAYTQNITSIYNNNDLSTDIMTNTRSYENINNDINTETTTTERLTETTTLTQILNNVTTDITFEITDTITTFTTNETTTKETITDGITTEELTTEESTTEDSTTDIIIDQMIDGNTSKSNLTHEAIIQQTTLQPQEQETDDFEIIETDNLPPKQMETTATTTEIVNVASVRSKYDNESDINKLLTTLTTTEVSINPTNSDDERDKNVKEKKRTTSSLLLDFKEQKPVCEDLGCKITAARILNRIKHSGDPCDDFYEYACGGDNFDNIVEDNWKRIAQKLQEISDESPVHLQIFRKFYQTCVSFHSDFNYEQRVKEAKDILHSVSRLYDRTQQIPKEVTLTELLTRLLLLGSSPLFDISVDADKNYFVFQMLPGKRNSFLRDETILSNGEEKCFRNLNKKFSESNINLNETYLTYKNCIFNHSDYLETVEKALKVFGEFSNLDEYNATWYIQEIRTVIEWEILSKLETLPEVSSIKYDISSKKYNVFKISELEKMYPLIKWSVLFSNLVGEIVDDNEIVHVYFQNYFDELFKDFFMLADRAQHNTLLGMFAYDLFTTLVLPVKAMDYEYFCLRQSSRLLKEISSSMYLETWTDSDIYSARKDLENTFASVKAQMTNKIKDAEWLDEISKSSVLEKLDNIEAISGDISILKNSTYLDTKFEDVFKECNETYPQYVIALTRKNHKLLYNLWGKNIRDNINKCMWWHYTTPYGIKPITIYSCNSIVIPLGMALNIPKTIPQYVHLAQVGYPLAKAIGYHFDSVGINYDVDLSTESMKSYNSMEICGVNKYSYTMSHAVQDKQISFRVNGTITSNERIVEDMAISLILDMSAEVINSPLLPWVSDNYSREKVFLLIIAQEHCEKMTLRDYVTRLFESEHLPPSLLVRSFYANSEFFADTFQCRLGSTMNHQIKCPPFFDLVKEEDYYSI